ncbi:hypothetical protein [Lapidilactobacillus bayanensis]|uniref:hypothetical protein n=1 Tax=Lapidilactobacillus bayanensis TaxID=2485998 RepID=UPI000F79AE9E|nr:hypothetical protein [Lapidilactobacillus bayanensis]
MQKQAIRKQTLKLGGILIALVMLLSSCGTATTKQKSATTASTTAKVTKTKPKKVVKTDLTTIPLVGQWKNSGGAVFNFQANGKWIYQTAAGAKTDGTYQLVGAYSHQILLKIHGLDQSIGGIGNYLGLAFSKQNKSLFIVGFGQFTLQKAATNIGTTTSVRLPAALNQEPTTAKNLLVGTWMDTDETAETQLTTNFDPDGQYQRYNSATKQVETGHFQATTTQNNKLGVEIKLTNQNGKVTTETYIANETWTQLTMSKNKVSATYVKNQMPNDIQ